MTMAAIQLLFGAVAVAAFPGFMPIATASPPEQKDLLWLPLGDSITFGCGTDETPRAGVQCNPDAGGYRIPLAWALSQQGYNVSTMGTLSTGPSYVTEQWIRHEGHPGWRFDQIDEILNRSLATAPTPPDLVTIHLGTNDCGQGAKTNVTVAEIVQRANLLLEHLHSASPTSAVYLASMIGFPSCQDCADAVNAQLEALTVTYRSAGMNICYTPMAEWSGVCVSIKESVPLSGLCCSGEVHPTAAGYLRMASAFALSIAEGNCTLPARLQV